MTSEKSDQTNNPGDDATTNVVSLSAVVGGQATARVAMTWEAFTEQPLDAVLFVKLLAVCGGHAVEATVLWDAVAFHRTHGLEEMLSRTAVHYQQTYGNFIENERAVQRAMQSLTDQGLLDQWKVPRSAAKRFQLNWMHLEDRLSRVSGLVPGLGVAGAGFTVVGT